MITVATSLFFVLSLALAIFAITHSIATYMPAAIGIWDRYMARVTQTDGRRIVTRFSAPAIPNIAPAPIPRTGRRNMTGAPHLQGRLVRNKVTISARQAA